MKYVSIWKIDTMIVIIILTCNNDSLCCRRLMNCYTSDIDSGCTGI